MRFSKSRYYSTLKERDEFYQFIKSEYYSGKTSWEIAADIGCHRMTMYEYLKRAGTIFRKKQATSAIRGQKLKLILTLTRKKYTRLKIVELTGVHKNTITKIQQQYGLKKSKDINSVFGMGAIGNLLTGVCVQSTMQEEEQYLKVYKRGKVEKQY